MAVSYIGSESNNGSSSFSVDCPSNTYQGDVLILHLSYYGNYSASSFPQSGYGWVQIGSTTQYDASKGDYWKSRVYYNILGPVIESSYTIIDSGSYRTTATISAFRNVDTTDPIGNTSTNTGTGTSATATTINVQDTDNMILHLSSVTSIITVTPPTGTPTYTEAVDPGTNPNAAMSYATYSSTGATGSKSAAISSSSDYCAWHIELQVDSSAPPDGYNRTIIKFTNATDAGTYWTDDSNAADDDWSTLASRDVPTSSGKETTYTLTLDTNDTNTAITSAIDDIHSVTLNLKVRAIQDGNGVMTVYALPKYDGISGDELSWDNTDGVSTEAIDITDDTNAPGDGNWTKSDLETIDVAFYCENTATFADEGGVYVYEASLFVIWKAGIQLHYRKSSTTYDISLYDADTGWNDSLKVRVGTDTKYAQLDTNLSHTYATDLRVRNNGTTYAVLSQEGTPTDSTSAPPVTSSYIEIQRGDNGCANTTETDAPGTSFDSLTSAFVLNKCNRFCTAGTVATNSTTYYVDDLSGRIELTDTDEITFTRLATGNSSDFQMDWESWEYKGDADGANEFIVRSRNAVTITAGNANNTATLDNTPDDIDNCICFITGISNTNTGNNSNGLTAYAYISGTNTLNVERGGSTNTTIVQVVTVEFTGSNWRVGHGYQSASSSDSGTMTLYSDVGLSSAFTINDTDNAFVASAQSCAASGDTDEAIADNYPCMRVASTTTVSWTYNGQHAATNRQRCYVLENSEITVTEFNSNTSNTAGWTNVDITSAGLTDISKAAIFATSTSSGGGTAFGRGWRNYQITSTTNARHFCHRSGNTMVHYIAIVSFEGMS